MVKFECSSKQKLKINEIWSPKTGATNRRAKFRRAAAAERAGSHAAKPHAGPLTGLACVLGREYELVLDGRPQDLPAPMGDMAQANVEWEDDAVVGYYRGKHGLEYRLSMRDDDGDRSSGEVQLCIEFRIPFKDGTVSATRVFTKKAAQAE